jgi:protoporphyrinogen oxidase
MAEKAKQKIGIIGAGVTGMAAAWDLVNAGHDVTIYEAGSEVGGLAAGFRDPAWDWTLEKYYHHWFEGDEHIHKLVADIGHSDKLIFPRPKTSYWLDSKIYRSEISLSALLLPLSIIGTLRLGLAGAFLKLTSNWRTLEKHTAHDWLTRYMGREVYEKLWRPLLIGKFSDAYAEVNMAWFWARIKARSLRLGTFQGGFQAFLETLGDAVKAKGATIHLETPVAGISQQGDQVVLTVKGETAVFDRVLSTLSPKQMLTLTDGLADTSYGKQMAELRSIGAVCVVLSLKQSLLTDGTYWLSLPASSADRSANQTPFLALVEHTNWMEKKHYNDEVIVYCGDYVPADHDYFQMSDEALVERFVEALPQFNADFSTDWIQKSWVFRAPYAQPIPGVNHSAKIPALQTAIPGLYWASMSQVYPWDRGTNFSVEMGREVAQLMMDGSVE